jgi:hypothetical protein
MAGAGGRLTAARAELVAALRGRGPAPHRFMLQLPLRQLAALAAAGQALAVRLEAALRPFRAVVDRLITIPVVSQVALLEIFLEMAGRCPVSYM